MRAKRLDIILVFSFFGSPFASFAMGDVEALTSVASYLMQEERFSLRRSLELMENLPQPGLRNTTGKYETCEVGTFEMHCDANLHVGPVPYTCPMSHVVGGSALLFAPFCRWSFR